MYFLLHANDYKKAKNPSYIILRFFVSFCSMGLLAIVCLHVHFMGLSSYVRLCNTKIMKVNAA